MRRSQQAFSAPSKQTKSSNAKDELSSTASINASSTTLIPSSELLASKPRDSTLKREQNSCYEHDNGLFQRVFQTDICEFEFSQPSQAVVSSHHLRFSFRLAHSALSGGSPHRYSPVNHPEWTGRSKETTHAKPARQNDHHRRSDRLKFRSGDLPRDARRRHHGRTLHVQHMGRLPDQHAGH